MTPCGTTWASNAKSSYGTCPETGQCSLAQICPTQSAQLSMRDIMENAAFVGSMLTTAESDTAWFTALMDTDLYSPNGFSTSVTSTCVPRPGVR